MKILSIFLLLFLSACASIQEKKQANVAPELSSHLDEDNYKDNDDNAMVLMIGNCKGLENSEYCENLKKQKEDNDKLLDESLKNIQNNYIKSTTNDYYVLMLCSYLVKL